MEGNVFAKYCRRINQEMGAFLKINYRWNFGENLKDNLRIPSEGESVGYTVKTMEKDFPISNYPLEQTEFLYDSKQGTVIKELRTFW